MSYSGEKYHRSKKLCVFCRQLRLCCENVGKPLRWWFLRSIFPDNQSLHDIIPVGKLQKAEFLIFHPRRKFNILRHILKNMEAKSSTHFFAPFCIENESKIFHSNGPFPTFSYPIFANCVPTKTMFVHVSQREIFFSLN